MVRRRDFIARLGGSLALPLTASAQPGERMRRVGVLTTFDETDPWSQKELSAFTRGLAELGWIVGRNLQIDIRQSAGNLERASAFAKELVGLQPDVILSESTPPTAALQRETRTIPIVIQGVSDPIGSGFIAGLPRPGGNITALAGWSRRWGASG